MRTECENLWKQAVEDVTTADVCFDGERWYAVAFNCQQATEKALKAVWCHTKKDAPPKSHNLLQLSKEVRSLLNINQQYDS